MIESTGSKEERVPDSPSDAAANSARFHPASHLRLWIPAVLGLTGDLVTKHWAFTRLNPTTGWPVINHLMSFHRSLNTGALFGLGKGLTPVFILASFLALGFVLFLFVHSSRDRWSLHIALGLVLAGALGNLYDRAFQIADVMQVNDAYGTRSIAGAIVRQDANTISFVENTIPGRSDAERWTARRYSREREIVGGPTQKGVVRDFVRMEPRITIGSRSFDIWPWVFNMADVLLVVGVALLMLNFWRDRRKEQAETAPTAAAS